MKKCLSLLLALCLTLSLTACGSKADTSADAAAGSQTQDNAPTEAPAGEPVELIVFAAASMTETLTEIAELYKTAAPKVTITYNFDSSGKLLTQNNVVFSGGQIGLLHVNQVRGQRIVLCRVNTQHDADRHAAGALQHHVTGGQRRNARDAL